MKLMQARFNSTCAQTGDRIRKGDPIAYDPSERKAYGATSEKYRAAASGQGNGQGGDPAGRMIQDMENEAADSWAAANL